MTSVVLQHGVCKIVIEVAVNAMHVMSIALCIVVFNQQSGALNQITLLLSHHGFRQWVMTVIRGRNPWPRNDSSRAGPYRAEYGAVTDTRYSLFLFTCCLV